METKQRKAFWDFKTSEDGAYIQCDHCGRKVGAKEFIFAMQDWFTCPKCGADMNLARLDYDRILEEASNEH